MSYWPILGIFKTASARGIIMGYKKSVNRTPPQKVKFIFRVLRIISLDMTLFAFVSLAHVDI